MKATMKAAKIHAGKSVLSLVLALCLLFSAVPIVSPVSAVAEGFTATPADTINLLTLQAEDGSTGDGSWTIKNNQIHIWRAGTYHIKGYGVETTNAIVINETVSGQVNLILEDVNITSSVFKSPFYNPALSTEVCIELRGVNKLTSTHDSIEAMYLRGATTIQGDGYLEVSSTAGSAMYLDCNLTIESGEVYVETSATWYSGDLERSSGLAAIDIDRNATLEVKGGKLTAIGADAKAGSGCGGGAGIGGKGGIGTWSESGDVSGNVIITGGTVIARGGKGDGIALDGFDIGAGGAINDTVTAADADSGTLTVNGENAALIMEGRGYGGTNVTAPVLTQGVVSDQNGEVNLSGIYGGASTDDIYILQDLLYALGNQSPEEPNDKQITIDFEVRVPKNVYLVIPYGVEVLYTAPSIQLDGNILKHGMLNFPNGMPTMSGDGKLISTGGSTYNKVSGVPLDFTGVSTEGNFLAVKGDALEAADWAALKAIGVHFHLHLANEATDLPVDALKEAKLLSISGVGVKGTIGQSALVDRGTLELISLPYAESANHLAFWDGTYNQQNEKLEHLYLPRVHTVVNGFYAKNLKAVHMPWLETAGRDLLSYCENIEEASFPRLKNAGRTAFWDMPSLKKLSLPLIETFETNAFIGTSLELLDGLELNKNYFTIVNTAKEKALYDKDKTALYAFFEDESITEYTAPDSLVSIIDCAFNINPTLETAYLGNVQKIGAGAFDDCANLSHVEASYAREAEANAFSRCNSLKYIRLGDNTSGDNGLTSLGNFSLGDSAFEYIELPDTFGQGMKISGIAFRGANNLKAISFTGDVPLKQNVDNLFDGLSEDVIIYVDGEYLDNYKKRFSEDSSDSSEQVTSTVKDSQIVAGKLPAGAWHEVTVTTDGTKGATAGSSFYLGWEGAEIQLYANAPKGYTFKKWQVVNPTDGSVVIENDKFVMPASSVEVKAIFAPKSVPPAPPVEPEWENPFEDVSKTDWFYGDVEFVNENDLMKGMTAKTFAPISTLTRGMLATILHRIAGEPAPSAGFESSFTDIPEKAYYANAVHWGEEAGVFEGIGDGKFSPGGLIKREDMAVMIWRYAEHIGWENETGEITADKKFADHKSISTYAIEAVYEMKERKILLGNKSNVFAPSRHANRAETAAVVHRLVDYINKNP